MDSDDYIEPEFLEMLYKTAIENDADITCCNFNLYYPEKDMKVYMPFTSMPGVYSKTKALRKLRQPSKLKRLRDDEDDDDIGDRDKRR